MVLSDFIIPVTVLFIVVFGSLKRVNLYETFLEGAKEGLHTVVNILPTLLGLMVAVEVLRAGGLLELLTKLLAPLEHLVGFPAELAPLTLVRLVSSSAAVGLLTEIFAAYGPDSFLGRSASVMMYCTETVFYTMSLYFLSVGIGKTQTVPVEVPIIFLCHFFHLLCILLLLSGCQCKDRFFLPTGRKGQRRHDHRAE